MLPASTLSNASTLTMKQVSCMVKDDLKGRHSREQSSKLLVEHGVK